VRLTARLADQEALGGGVGPDRLVRAAQRRVEVDEVGEARRVELLGAGGVVGAVVAVGAAGEEVHLGLGGGDRHVGIALRADHAGLLRELDPVRLAGLEPRAEGPGSRGRRLAAGGGGEALERVGRRRAGEDPERKRRGVDLDAPSVGRVGAEAEAARLVAVHEHAVAAAREQPRDRVVGRVVALAVGPGRDDRARVLAVLRTGGAVGHVVLDLEAAVVDGVRPRAEAEEALAGGGGEADAECGGGCGGRLRLDRDRPLAARAHPHAQLAAATRLHHRDDRVAFAPQLPRARRARPAGRGAIAEPCFPVLAQGYAAGAAELEVPRGVGNYGFQRAAARPLRRRGCRGRADGSNEESDPRDAVRARHSRRQPKPNRHFTTP
jgi:hypothetical protein